MKADYSRMKKMLYLYSNCEEPFIENISTRIDDLNLEQLEFLWGTYKDMTRNIGAIGIAYNEEETSSYESTKEDVRQIIFGTRRDGKWNKFLKSIRDIKI
jgi:hypothetical protein